MIKIKINSLYILAGTISNCIANYRLPMLMKENNAQMIPKLVMSVFRTYHDFFVKNFFLIMVILRYIKGVLQLPSIPSPLTIP